MKLVYNISGTFNSGGMERVLANKANYLVGQGYELTIVTTDQQGRVPYFDLDSRIRQVDLGVNYADLAGEGLLKKVWNYRQKQKTHKKRLAKLLKERKADVVVSMFDHEVSFLHGISDGSKKVVEIHFSRFKRLQYGRTGLWGKVDAYRSAQDLKVAQKYDRFVVLTHEDAGYWGDLPNMEVIPNANSFAPSTISDCTAKRVIAVGRYDYQKGFEDLIAAWERVYAKCPDWHLDIFGGGELKEAMQQQIDVLGLAEAVHLRAPVKDIEKEYVSSSILAMSSRYEGLPMTLLEAQVCGLPMVAYACKCGPKDIIVSGENGYLIEQGDQKDLAEKLIALMEDEEARKKMGRAVAKNAECFTEEKIMQKWMDLFTTLTRNQS